MVAVATLSQLKRFEKVAHRFSTGLIKDVFWVAVIEPSGQGSRVDIYNGYESRDWVVPRVRDWANGNRDCNLNIDRSNNDPNDLRK